MIRRIFRNELFRIGAGLSLFVPGAVLGRLGYDTLSLLLLLASLLITGSPVFISAVKGILRRDFLDEKFLMSVASVGAFVIGESTEGTAVMLFFLVGSYFEHKAIKKNRTAIRALLDICPDTARVVIDGAESLEDADDVEAGSVIVIRPGERVPLDCRVVLGTCRLDTSSLTGESMPITASEGDEVYSGVIVLDSPITAVTVRTHASSRATRVLELVENARERKSRTENFITSFSRYYTPIVVALAAIIATFPAIIGVISWQSSIHRALSFLVISCPCALVISVPMAFFGGIGSAATQGILYKGGDTFSPIANIESAVFDKTGTLTTGRFQVIDTVALIDEAELFSLVSAAERYSVHPIAVCLCSLSDTDLRAESVREIPGRGIVASIDGHDVAVGNLSLMHETGAAGCEEGYTVYVSRDGIFIGAFLLGDEIKREAGQAIAELRALGVERTYILSGDREESVLRVAAELGIDEALGSLLPEDKYARLEDIISSSHGGVVYVGDGINDAPCLTRADVGIAMGRGTDSAIESADAVIMSDDLSRLPDTVRIARRTLAISRQNIVFAIGVKLAVMILAGLDLVGMWMAVVADVGVAVVAILNSLRALIPPHR